jgi:hypothetical protein
MEKIGFTQNNQVVLNDNWLKISLACPTSLKWLMC